MSIKIVNKKSSRENELHSLSDLLTGEGVFDGIAIYANFGGRWVAFGGGEPRVVLPGFRSFTGRKVRLTEVHYEEID